MRLIQFISIWLTWEHVAMWNTFRLANAAKSDGDEDHDMMEYAPKFEHPEYAFSYGVKDLHTGDVKSQWESREGDSIKGHYSILEPDGSIRTVHYTADAKNGFNAVVKTVGANSHPVTETPHSENGINDDTSQSKINHYSKDQEHIVLSSDIKPLKKPIEDLTHSHPKIPSLIEFRPHARIKQVPMELEPGMRERLKEARDQYYQGGSGVGGIDALLDFKAAKPKHKPFAQPISVPYENEESDWRAMVVTQHDMPEYRPSYGHHSADEYFAPKHSPISGEPLHTPQQGRKHLPGNTLRTDFIASKPYSHQVTYSNNNPNKHGPHSGGINNKNNYKNNNNNNKKSVYTTPGLKNYASPNHKFGSPSSAAKGHSSSSSPTRLDYSSYFQRKAKKQRHHEQQHQQNQGPLKFPKVPDDEQSAASERLVQSMVRRDNKHLTPMYANRYGGPNSYHRSGLSSQRD